MRVLIFGLGLNQGGVGSAKYFAQKGMEVKVTDLKSGSILKLSLDQLKDFSISYTLGEHRYEDIDWADLIIKNPAVKPNNPYIEYATKIGKKVEMDMGIFLEYVNPSQIIGVTGTKGKSTTATLIYKILKASLHVNSSHTRHGLGEHEGNIILAGNIGKSVLDVIPDIKQDTLIVLEISSFQLEAFDQHKVSPRWSVITNITPDHLNYYSTMNEYLSAKRIIGKYQTAQGFLFLRKNDPITAKVNFTKDFKGRIIYFSKVDLPKKFHPHLMGDHNLENMAAALAVARVFNISQDQTLQTMANFKGVPFRIELIKTWNGVKIYNDTVATSPEASIQAIKTLGGNLKSPLGCLILICGGMNKKMEYTKYVTIVHKFVNKVFFLEGDATDTITSSLRAKRSNLKIHGPYNNLEQLLTDVKSEVQSGNVILFSPAATSFNLFQNEFDRGRKFNLAVQKVFG